MPLFVSGLKAGGFAAVGCSVLGFTGGAVLKRKEELAEEAAERERDDPATDQPLNESHTDRPAADPYKED